MTDTTATQLQFFATDPSTHALIGLVVRPNDVCRCGENVAVVKGGKGPHAAALVCSGCGGHRGWLSTETANFVVKTIEQFGRPGAPIEFRRGATITETEPTTEGNEEMAFTLKPGQGTLHKNDRKEAPSHADYKGTVVTPDGTECWLDGYKKTSKDGKAWLSLSIKPKTEQTKAKPDFNDSVEF